MKITVAAALLLATVSTPALAAARLPTDVVPVSYDITIDPDAQKMTFTGTETVNVTVNKATSTIILNAADMTISRATIDGKAVLFKLDNDAQQLTLTLPAPAKLGNHVITFAWTGKLLPTDLKPLDLDGVNVARPAGKVVLYTPAFGASTKTPTTRAAPIHPFMITSPAIEPEGR